MLGNGLEPVHGRGAESAFQPLEQRTSALLDRLGLEQIDALVHGGPKNAAFQADRHGRNGQAATFQAILDELEQSLSIESGLAQIEAFDGSRPAQMLEGELESADPLRDLAAVLGRDSVRGVKVDRPDLESVFLDLTGRSLRD